MYLVRQPLDTLSVPNVAGIIREEFSKRDLTRRVKPGQKMAIAVDSRGISTLTEIVATTGECLRHMGKVNFTATYTNTPTAGVRRNAGLPIALETDKEVLETALAQFPYPERVRMVRIVNTLRFQKYWVTETLMSELREQDGVTIDEMPLRFRFDNEGRLLAFVDQV